MAKWVMVVDDDATNLKMAGHILSKNNMRVTALKSGRAMLDYIKEKGSPDLILLDGGQGHVNVITPLVRAMGINVPIFGLVKDSKHRTRAATASDHEISLHAYRKAFALVTQIQDEVHRFAISFTKARHAKNAFAVGLTSVKGIGEKKAQKLMTEYKTREALSAATVDELAETAGVGQEIALSLYKYIHRDEYDED